ncbi:MAG: calcium/sodium antiporter [Acholeplasmataceae bacterium]|nr:calcium/sodium antiporter [Acholeplasmataceae bacterium]
MDVLFHLAALIAGFIFLIKGADFFVVSASSIAKKFNVPTLIIGLTLVAFGTSLPELAVSFAASISAKQQGMTADIAIGNIIGSNIANMTLILGFTALMAPVIVRKNMFKKEFPILLLSSILILVVALFFQQSLAIVWWESLLLLALFGLYMFYVLKSPKDQMAPEDLPVIDMKKAIVLLLVGLIGVTLGGSAVTWGAENLALNFLVNSFHMDATKATTLVGLSIVALGTSLPELVTSMMAAKKGENEIALGNVVGSNIFNTLLVVGLSGSVVSLGIEQAVILDMGIVIAITVIVLIFSWTKHVITRFEGLILGLLYVTYIIFIIIRSLGIF